MSIETDIKQNLPFKSPHHRVTVNLLFTSNWLVNNQIRQLRPFKLTLQQYNVLRILRGQYPNPVKISDISERMLDKMSNASRLVDKVVGKQLAVRTECAQDRRAVDVVINEKGLALLEELDAHQREWDGTNNSNLTDEEANQLSLLLDRLRE